jgi:hypothetical protein
MGERRAAGIPIHLSKSIVVVAFRRAHFDSLLEHDHRADSGSGGP